MSPKLIELPPKVAKTFAKDMRAYHAEPNTMKRVEIAERQLDVLQGFQGAQDKSCSSMTSSSCLRR